MERVILFLMSQIIFGILERTLDEEIHFSPHPLEEFGKILWQDGEAVGFYTIKKKGNMSVVSSVVKKPHLCLCAVPLLLKTEPRPPLLNEHLCQIGN